MDYSYILVFIDHINNTLLPLRGFPTLEFCLNVLQHAKEPLNYACLEVGTNNMFRLLDS